MIRAFLALALLAGAGVQLLPARAAQQSPAGPEAASSDPAPSARIVRLDAIVTDRQGRPIPDLKPADFEIVENGVAQKIDAVEPRGSGEQAEGGPEAARAIESAEDEARAARRPGTRVVALLLDEFHVSAGPASERVRDAGLRFVNERLGPSDLLVVLKPLDSITAIRFTRDRDAPRRAIASFTGRKGDYAALTEFEEKYIGRAPAAVQAARAQIVFSGLRALTMKLGELQAGRSAIVLVSEGFAGEPSDRTRRVSDVQSLVRAASRHNVSIYTFDPAAGAPAAGDAAGESSLHSLAEQTGGEAVRNAADLDVAFQRVARDLGSYYLLSYTSSHAADGRFYDVQVRVRPPHAQIRTRNGYWAPLRAELLRSSGSRPAPPARALRKSPLIDTWLGLTVEPDGRQRVIFTWEPAAPRTRGRAPASGPSVVAVRATTPAGAVLYEGEIRPPRGAPGVVREQAAVFDADPGRIQMDLAIMSADGTRIDTAAHDIEVPDAGGADPLILPPQVFRTASYREFRAISGNPAAAPIPAREFRRTERLLLRIPTHSPSGARVELTARVLNRTGQVLRDIPAVSGRADGVTQFDLPLAWLAPGEYTIELNARTGTGSATEIVRFRVRG